MDCYEFIIIQDSNLYDILFDIYSTKNADEWEIWKQKWQQIGIEILGIVPSCRKVVSFHTNEYDNEDLDHAFDMYEKEIRYTKHYEKIIIFRSLKLSGSNETYDIHFMVQQIKQNAAIECLGSLFSVEIIPNAFTVFMMYKIC